jgi:TetR/AcrR family transcriptional regulator
MATTAAKARPGSRHQPERTRAAILAAAAREFAGEGLAGARTENIARLAGVNKALLYYYFRDKEALYGAVLDHVFGGVAAKLGEVLDRDLPPRQKVMAYVGAHFDYIAASAGTSLYPKLIQRELMMDAGGQGSAHIQRVVQKYLRPTFSKLVETLKAGIQSGDFRPVDPIHAVSSMVGVVVFYFSSRPILRYMLAGDPLSPQRLAERRAAILDFVAAALFHHPNGRPEGPASRKGGGK